MIKKEKIVPAFSALQEIFIIARWRIGRKDENHDVYDLMDGAEYLAGLACREDDQTIVFEQYLEMLSQKHSCSEALRAFREKQ